jgi:TPR repeat protein
MKQTCVVLALLASCAVACGGANIELAAQKQASVPYDPHPAPPDPMEVAANPCRYGEVGRCIERCETGDAQACNSVGVTFEWGPPEWGDGHIAQRFYSRACDASYAPGCTNLAWLYSLGRGVPRDPSQALALFTRAYEYSRLACRRGDMSGCMMAGEMIMQGRGVDQDDRAALAYFEQACAAGDRKGCDYVETLR